MTQSICWGICGCGGIAACMADAIPRVAGHRVQAVAARDPARAAAFAVAHGGAVVHGSYAALFADPAVDVVYIATVHNQHYPLLRQALTAGKPVVCEKPLVMTAAQAQAVVDLARARRILLLEKMWIRFMPVVLRLHEAIAAGRLGVPHLVRSDFTFFHACNPASRLFDPLQAGGATLDVGCYPLAMMQDFLGPITAVEGLSAVGKTGVDESSVFVTRHAGGGLGVGSAGMCGPGPQSLEIVGSEGIASASRSWPPTEVTIRRRDGTVAETIRDEDGGGFEHTVREVERCLMAGLIESPRMTHAQSIELAHWMEVLWRRAGVRYPDDALTQ